MVNLKPAKKRKLLFVKKMIRVYFKLYCDRSTIHGVRYLFDDTLNSIERLCWTAIIIASLFMVFTFYLVLSHRFNDQTLITVVDDAQYPVFNVFFPAVGICNQKRINWNKFEESKSIFLPRNSTSATHTIYYEFVKRMETLRFGSFAQFEDMDDKDLEQLDFINVTALARFLSFTCEDMFEGDCIWRKVKYSCCDIFVFEKTEVGFCLVFNSAISGTSRDKVAADSFYPWRNNKSGEDTGLDIKLKLNTTTSANATDVNEGIFLMIKKSEQWSDAVYTLQSNTDTLVIIRPQMTSTDPNTEDTSPELRKCLLDTETDHYLYKNIEGLQYQQRNCLNICHREHLLQYCNCTLTMFFPYNESHRECRPADFGCMHKNRDIFSYDRRLEEEAYVKNLKGGMLCPCLISCNYLEYIVAISTLPNFYEQSNNTKFMTIDVHFQSELMLRYLTSREFTYLEMIANLGGIIGLFLGASIVSAVEIAYHLTIGICVFLTNNHLLDRFWNFIRKYMNIRLIDERSNDKHAWVHANTHKARMGN